MNALKFTSLSAAVVMVLVIARPAQAETMLFGSVYDAPGSQLVLAVSTELVSVSVDRATPVTINGEQANIADLERGDRVRVAISRDLDRQVIALKIDATRRAAFDPLIAFTSVLE